jgi:PAS domain S-box-containing protein
MKMWSFGGNPDRARRRSDPPDETQPPRSRWWLPGVGVGAVAVVGLIAFPYGSPPWVFLLLCTSLISLVILFGAALTMPSGVRSIWWLLLAFQAMTFAAIGPLADHDPAAGDGALFPATADVVFLAAYIPVFVALGLLIHRLNPGRDREAWIDSSILTVAAAAIFGLFLIVPVLDSPGLDGWAIAVGTAYPLLDLAVLSGLIWLLVGGGRPQSAMSLLAVSFGFTLTADVIRDIAMVIPDVTVAQSWLDALHIAGLIAMAAAATLPSAESIARPRRRPDSRVTTTRLAILAIGVIAVPSLVVVQLWNSAAQPTLLLALAAVAVIILAVMRIQILVTAIDRQRQVTELVLDSAGDGIVGLDREGFVLFANLSARRMLRCRESDLLGRRFHDIAHHEHPDGTPFPWYDCPVRELVRSGAAGLIPDQVYVRRDGTTFPVEMITSPLLVDATVTGAVLSFRDVSERQAVDQLKNQFVSVVSHELRTPLTSIKGSLQILNSGIVGPLNEDQQELMTMALNNSERLGQLVNDILDLERLDAGHMPLAPADVSAASLAQQAVASMTGAATAAEVTLILADTDDDTGLAVHVDPHRMVQVLTNLLGNAIKFSNHGASVTVATTRVDDEVHISVTDSGRGIPTEQLDSVFDRFGQVESGDSRREGGTGLGLAIAREIVTRSAGRIDVASTLGTGSTFTVVLPFATTTAADGEDA